MSSLFTPQLNIKDPSNQQVGRIGEILAAYYLELYGVQTEIIRTTGCDLWCRGEDGLMFTCEVKTTIAPSIANHAGYEYSRYRFSAPEGIQRSADIYAFVALDTQAIRFILSDDLSKCTIKAMKPEDFNPNLMFSDLDACLQRIKKRAA
jgi:hypothetical protein